jgi:hypothetical protein
MMWKNLNSHLYTREIYEEAGVDRLGIWIVSGFLCQILNFKYLRSFGIWKWKHKISREISMTMSVSLQPSSHPSILWISYTFLWFEKMQIYDICTRSREYHCEWISTICVNTHFNENYYIIKLNLLKCSLFTHLLFTLSLRWICLCFMK